MNMNHRRRRGGGGEEKKRRGEEEAADINIKRVSVSELQMKSFRSHLFITVIDHLLTDEDSSDCLSNQLFNSSDSRT